MNAARTIRRKPAHVFDHDARPLPRQEPRDPHLVAIVERDRVSFAPECRDLDVDSISRLHVGTIPLTTTVVAVVLRSMTSVDRSWPVATVALGPTQVGTVAWRFAGQLMVTVVAKASFALVPDGPMARLVPEPIQRTESSEGGPMGSVRRPSEVAPQLRYVDVTMTGHAHPPYPGATEVAVRLAVQTGDAVLLDRLVYAVGSPHPTMGGRQPLGPITLGYERAFGGIGSPDNPLGVGFGANVGESPNLVDPRDPTSVASLAPIPASFPCRKRLLGDWPRSGLSDRIIALPDEFDWSYLQAAPLAQRMMSMPDAAWLTLEGISAEQPRIQTQIPALTALARVHASDGEPSPVPSDLQLRLDLVHVDGDQRTCQLVFRGSFPVQDDAALTRLLVFAAIEPTGADIAWPSRDSDLFHAPRRPDDVATIVPAQDPGVAAAIGFDSTVAGDGVRFEGTVALAPGAAPMTLGVQAPFALAGPGTNHATVTIPGAPWARSPRLEVPTSAPFEGTMALNAPPPPSMAEAERRRLADEETLAAKRAEEEALAAKLAEEKRREEEAAAALRREAEERRKVEAEKFLREQEEAKREAERRAAQKANERREQTKQVKQNLYGAFKKKT